MGRCCRSSGCQIAGRSCGTGVVVCLCLFAIIFAVDGISREMENRRMHDETESYRILSNCTVLKVELMQRGSAFSGSCVFAWYLLDLNAKNGSDGWRSFVRSLDNSGHPDLSSSGVDLDGAGMSLRQAYSNFYNQRCGGLVLWRDAVGSVIPCWSSPGDTTLVRLSAVVERDSRYLAYSIGLMILGGAPLVWFVTYSAFVCIYGCCREAEHQSGTRTPDRQPSHVLPHRPPMRTEPFELVAADPSEKTWAERFTNNSYAQAVLAALARLQQRRQRRKRLQEHQVAEGIEGEPSEVRHSSGAAEAAAAAVPVAAEHSARQPDEGEHVTINHASPRDVSDETAVNILEDCQVCFEPLRKTLIVLPCGHYMCEPCGVNFLADSFRGFQCQVRCPQCRAQYPDTAVMRVQIDDGTSSPVLSPVVRSSRSTPRGPPARLDPDVQENEDYDSEAAHEPY